jgi:hypothetical protein
LDVLYDLTALTGREASEDRRTVIMSYDVSHDTLRTLIVAGIPGLACMGLFAPLLGLYAVIVGALIGLTVGVLVYARSSSGLRLRLWRQLWNKRRAANGRVYLRGRIVDPEPSRVTVMIGSLAP